MTRLFKLLAKKIKGDHMSEIQSRIDRAYSELIDAEVQARRYIGLVNTRREEVVMLQAYARAATTPNHPTGLPNASAPVDSAIGQPATDSAGVNVQPAHATGVGSSPDDLRVELEEVRNAIAASPTAQASA